MLNLKTITIMTNYNIAGGVLLKYYGNAAHPSIPKDVTEIYGRAFLCCDTITSIVIPSSVTDIDSMAFDGCKNLASIKIPSSVKWIGEMAFFDIKDVIPQYNANGSLRAFKAFFHNWTCMHDFQYEVGKSYHQDGHIECCSNGFHACPNPLYIFDYYHGSVNALRFAEVELSGDMDNEVDKVAASDIKIVRELTISELAAIYNSMEKV